MSNAEHAIIAEGEGRRVSGTTFQQLKTALIECVRKCSSNDFNYLTFTKEVMRLRLLALENLSEDELSRYLMVDDAVSHQYRDLIGLDWLEATPSRGGLK